MHGIIQALSSTLYRGFSFSRVPDSEKSSSLAAKRNVATTDARVHPLTMSKIATSQGQLLSAGFAKKEKTICCCRVCQKRKNYLLLQGLPKKKKLFVAKKLFRAWSVPCEQAVEQSIASLAKSTPPKSMDSAVVIQSVTHGIPSSGFSNLMGGDL